MVPPQLRIDSAPRAAGDRGIGVRDDLGGPDVGQVVLPATPGGSPAAREWQVNVPLTRNNDLPYRFFGARGFCHGPGGSLLRKNRRPV